MSTINLNESDWDLPVDLPIEVRVKQGMMLLDEKYGPEWVHRIDVDTLELSKSCRCVLGQLCGSFSNGLVVLYGGASGESHKEGFCADEPEYPELTDAWKAAIVARREELSS